MESPGQRILDAGVGRQPGRRRLAAGRKLPAGLGPGGLADAPVSDGLSQQGIMTE